MTPGALLNAGTTRHRTDIQGLRALAVTLVVLYHLSSDLVPGGYIGVDVFFVISGFLITGHLLREINQTGTVKLTRFWGRRILRLMPSALLVLMVSALAVIFLLPRSTLIQNLSELGFAAIYVLNWNLALNSIDYLAASTPPSVAQHFWSLSVEEQFYLAWPILLLLAAWLAIRVRHISLRTGFAVALVIVFLVSLLISIIETGRSEPSAYFFTTTRAWEFAAGGLIALVPPLLPNRVWTHLVFSWLGVALVLGSALVFNSQTPFPGWTALVPVIGTALLIWVGNSSSTWTPQFFAQAGPIRYLGDISYVVYLWHWPLIFLFVTTQGKAPGWKWMLALAALTVALAALTHHFVEDPLRLGPGPLKRSTPIYTFMATGMAAVCLMTFLPAQAIASDNEKARLEALELVDDPTNCFGAYSLTNNCESPHVWTSTVNPQVAAADSYVSVGIPSCPLEPVGPNLRADCALSSTPQATKTVAFVGDSYANQLSYPVSKASSTLGWQTYLYSLSGCTMFAPLGEGDYAHACREWSRGVWKKLTNDPTIEIVIISIRTLDSVADQSGEARRVIGGLLAANKQVVVVRNTAGFDVDVPRCLEEAEPNTNACAIALNSANDWLVPVVEETGAELLDLRSHLCSEGTCHTVIGGTIVYFDRWHLTTTFSKTLTPWLTTELSRITSSFPTS